ncbi:hypothetical protein ACIQWR_01115 [Streptomyces sp. NPDC098789]|uniref:hypothetical protein n=1 Tax=Streptomyces sp. NPDC098789 TaxID=3366098 RepID=UPI003816703A
MSYYPNHEEPSQLGPAVILRKNARPDALGRTDTGQVYGRGMSVWTAVWSARASWARRGTEDDMLGTLAVEVYEYEHVGTGKKRASRRTRTLFRRGHAGRPDVDLLPDCPTCGWVCRDPSAHGRLVAAALCLIPSAATQAR